MQTGISALYQYIQQVATSLYLGYRLLCFRLKSVTKYADQCFDAIFLVRLAVLQVSHFHSLVQEKHSETSITVSSAITSSLSCCFCTLRSSGVWLTAWKNAAVLIFTKQGSFTMGVVQSQRWPCFQMTKHKLHHILAAVLSSRQAMQQGAIQATVTRS